MTRTPSCPNGHAMRFKGRFRFEFQAMGIELGADVTVWYCDECDVASADFDYAKAPA
jgi:hypothetical protein